MTQKLTDEQFALLAERLTDVTMANLDPVDLERIVYDIYLDEFLHMEEEDLLLEAEMYEVGVPTD
jgi:hypothetical protein